MGALELGSANFFACIPHHGIFKNHLSPHPPAHFLIGNKVFMPNLQSSTDGTSCMSHDIEVTCIDRYLLEPQSYKESSFN